MVQISFKGKQFVQNHHLAVKYHQLVADKKASLTEKISLHDNLIIHGDNLAALKALLPTYAGKVKCIYIDPPYNTGDESWVYNDNVNSPMMQDWLGKVVDKEDLTRHDKWLCMMWPRLRLLRELLAEDGFIFVNIDNHEQHRLRAIMDEVFGEENFKNEIITRRGVKNVQSQFDTIDSLATGHDTVLLYSKTAGIRLPKLMAYSEEDEPGKWDTFWRGTDRGTMRYELFGITPDKGQWRWKESRAKEAIKNYQEYLDNYAKEMSLDDYYGLRLQEIGIEPDFLRLGPDKTVQYYVGPRNYKIIADVWMNLPTSGSLTDFPHEKHVELLKRMIRWLCPQNGLVLDSFAGSGTTGHAVLAQNKEDGSNRKFILVEMEDYADKITAERMRRVIKGVKDAKDENLKKGLGGTFSYFKLGDPIEMETLLTGEKLPSYQELARYIFFTATGEQLDESKIDEKRFFIGKSQTYEVFMFYNPDVEFLKSTALTLERAKALGRVGEKRRLVFAPTKYLDQEYLDQYRIDFCQLPFEIYRLAR